MVHCTCTSVQVLYVLCCTYELRFKLLYSIYGVRRVLVLYAVRTVHVQCLAMEYAFASFIEYEYVQVLVQLQHGN
jgi:hypothetical protein